MNNFPRPCTVESSGSNYDGICHMLAKSHDGRPLALVETFDGKLELIYLDGIYRLEFK